MKIEHIAVWVCDLEGMRTFYQKYFKAESNRKYENPQKRFQSYFLTFAGGARLELMQRRDVQKKQIDAIECFGLAHFAVSVGSEKEVDLLTERLRIDGVRVLDGPRRTGDGYYESVILDPEGNRIEITADA